MSAGYPSKRAYTFQDGSDFPTNSIVYWTNATPDGGNSIVLQIYGNPSNPSNVPIREVYFPVVLGPIAFYLGKQGVSGTPDYVTQASGCECVDFDSVFFLTLQYQNGYPGIPAYVFLRNLPTGAFRTGPVGSQVTNVRAVEPLASTGGTSPIISLANDNNPLGTAFGGTGTTNPSISSGSGITVTGTPFNWTISSSVTGIASITVTAPLQSTGGTNPVLSLGTVGLANGGTGQTNPQLNNGPGIAVTGNIFQPSGASQWTVANTGVLECDPGGQVGNVLFESTDGSVTIKADNANNAINFSVVTGTIIAVVTQLNPAAVNGAGETVQLPPLPLGQWFTEVIVHGFGLGTSSNSITLTGAGWGTTVSDTIMQPQSTRTLYQAAIVPGGNQPSVTLTGNGVTVNSGTTFISCSIKAIRIS